MAEIEGFSELLKNMSAFPERLHRNVLRKGLRAGAATWRKSARSLAPKDTGALKRNIIVEKTSPRGNLGKVITSFAVGVDAGKVGKITGGKISGSNGKLRSASRREKAGEDPFYWIWQEKGFSAVGRKSSKGQGRQGRGLGRRRDEIRAGAKKVPGKRFLQNTFQGGKSSIFAAIRTKLKAEINKQDGR